MRLQNKVAVITGAASGIGLAMAKMFTAEGAAVIAADWNGERLDKAVEEITAANGTITGKQGNIADQSEAEGLIDFAIETHGHLDILVNNAGVMDYMAGVGEMDDETWRRVLGINLDGPMFTSRKAVQHMLERGSGSIVNVGSTASVSGAAAGAAYTTSKHGLLGLTSNTAWMYAKRGIRCNAVLPGGTATNIAESMPQEKLDPTGAARAGEYAGLIPGYMQPEDIAAVALFLASDEAIRINGAIITADAGWKAS